MNHIYIKEFDWWHYQAPIDSCWYWKKICRLRAKFEEEYTGNDWLVLVVKYTVRSGYEWRQPGETWQHWRCVWNSMSVPKHCFISWLVMHKGLLTRERLKKMGISQEESCFLCGSHVETIAHLFFECDFSKACLSIITQWTQQRIQNKDVDGY